MMKRIFLIIVSIFFLFSDNVKALGLSAESACLIIADTKEVVYEKNAYERMPMASTTKIMTAIVALEKSKPQDVVTVSANASSQEGSSIYIETGDKISMENLLYGLMLNSGNDAAVAIAEYISGNVENFSMEMNNLAQKIGVRDTSFKNPNGLDADGHYTTAYDLAVITSYAMQNEDFRRIVSTLEKSAKVNDNDILYFKNHNKLLKLYEGTIGVKTGYTKKCGRCLVSAAEKNGVELISVTLNAPDDWNDHMKMMDYGFSCCKNTEILKSGETIKTLYTTDKKEVGCILGEDIYMNIFEGRLPKTEINLHLPEVLLSPINAGEKIGEGDIMINGELYKSVDILADRDIFKSAPKITFGDIFFKVIKKFTF